MIRGSLSIFENKFQNVVKLYPVGLSDCIGANFFTTAIGSNGTLMPNTQASLMSPSCMVIPTFRLDDIMQSQIDFIKLDVEGAEYLALKGAEGLIRKNKPIITIEFSLEMSARVSGIDGFDLICWLQSLGYSGRVLGRNGLSQEIDSIENLKRDWGSITRIEDIAFVPT